ncbi:MAG: response regulator [Acidobacteria bacterium]|nr:response regulator [Acidobacteriota bacterium]
MSYKILLADDSVTVQKIITLTFTDEGADVLTVDNGDEAITRLRYMRPALVMADVSIPGKNGYEICEFIKSHAELRNTPVILLVPAFEQFDEERARRVGADHFLTKPFQSIRTLIATVKNLIESSAQRAGSSNEAVTRDTRIGNEYLTNPYSPEDTDVLELTDSYGGSGSESSETDGLRRESEAVFIESEAFATSTSYEKEPEIASREPAHRVRVENLVAARTGEKIVVSRSGTNDDWDHVLELDDVLADAWTETEAFPQNVSLSLPQHLIDEIVNRVVAQIMGKLPELLSRELANRLAPEVLEVVKLQQSAGKVVYQEPDSLLELDEV